MELIIDTSSDLAGIAVSHHGEVITLLTWKSEKNQTVELIPNIRWLTWQAKLELRSIEAIIVAKGPGSFNGLRVGIGTAKALAFSLDIPLLGVSTMEAEAYSYAGTGLPLCSIHKAGHDQVAVALYQHKGGQWHFLGHRITTVEALCRSIRRATIFCGQMSPQLIAAIGQKLGRRAIIAPGNTATRISSLAILGWQKLNRGERDDPARLEPLYLRPPHITQPKTPYPQQMIRNENP